MAYKFSCKSCNSEITSNYLKPGEEAFCFKCGSHMKVPHDAVEVAFVENLNKIAQPVDQPAMAAPIVGKFTGVKAWDPKWFHASSALVSFLPAGILWSLNFGRFGQTDRMRNSLMAVIFGFAVFLSILFAIEEIPRIAAMAINVAAGIYFYQSQSSLFKDFVSQGGIKASYKLPVSVTAMLVIPFTVLLVMNSNGDMPSSDEPGFDEYQQWSELESQDSLKEALAFARTMHAKYPRERLSSMALMFSYMDFGIYDSAAAIIKAYVAKSPDDIEAFSCQELVLAVMEADAGNYQQALVHVEHYIKLNPTRQEGYELRNEIRRSAGQ